MPVHVHKSVFFYVLYVHIRITNRLVGVNLERSAGRNGASAPERLFENRPVTSHTTQQLKENSTMLPSSFIYTSRAY